jgi:predicted nucleic acid-binding protein
VRPEEDSPLAVFDCQLFLQAALPGRGPAAACFDLVESGRVRLVVSRAVMAEVWDVLSRPKLLRKYPQLASARVSEFLEAVADQAQHLDPVPVGGIDHLPDLPGVR